MCQNDEKNSSGIYPKNNIEKDKPFKCTFKGCDKHFKTKGNLWTHLKIHSNDRPFKCNFEECKYSTKNKSNLKHHITQIHSVERPFKCAFEKCTYSTKKQGSLKIHIKQVHTNERPFKCTFENCEFSFKSQSNLLAHLKIHSENRSFKCKFKECTYSAKRQVYLNKHINKVHSENKDKRQKKSEKQTTNLLSEYEISFERELLIKFCNKKFCRIDFSLIINDVHFLIENDEKQHKYNQLSDEIDRMFNAHKSLKKQHEGRKRVFIRYNPDTYYIDKKRITNKTLTPEERIKKLIDLIHDISSRKEELSELSCYYCFYDVDSQGKLKIFENPEFVDRFKPDCKCIV